MNDQRKFNDCGLNDFVWNNDFRSWVLSPDANSDFYWSSWLKNNPEKKHVAEAAKKVIYSLKVEEQELPEEVINEEIDVVLEAIDRDERGS